MNGVINLIQENPRDTQYHIKGVALRTPWLAITNCEKEIVYCGESYFNIHAHPELYQRQRAKICPTCLEVFESQ